SSGVSFVRYRAESEVETALADARDRFGFDLSRARLRVGFSRGHLLEVVVHSSYFSSSDDGPGLDAANLLVRRLIGEELFEDWIGSVDVAPLRREGPLKLVAAARTGDPLALEEALPAVEAAVRGLYAELPDAPYRAWADDAKWTLLESEPGADLDYAEQDDV